MSHDDGLSHNPFLRRLSKIEEATAKRGVGQRRSPKAEKELAVRVGGKVTPGSGNKAQKGDVRVRGIARIEHKTTTLQTFALSREIVRKITEAGASTDEIPAIIVEFLDTAGKPVYSIACIPVHILESLIDEAKESK